MAVRSSFILRPPSALIWEHYCTQEIFNWHLMECLKPNLAYTLYCNTTNEYLLCTANPSCCRVTFLQSPIHEIAMHKVKIWWKKWDTSIHDMLLRYISSRVEAQTMSHNSTLYQILLLATYFDIWKTITRQWKIYTKKDNFNTTH